MSSLHHPLRNDVLAAWARAFDAADTETGWTLRGEGTYRDPIIWPGDAFIEMAVRLLPIAVIEQCIEAVGERYAESTTRAVSSFYAHIISALRVREAAL